MSKTIMGRWVDIFRTGTHKDSSGKEHTVTTGDLDGIVSKFDPQEREVPIVKGHPRHDDPAHGWIDKIRRHGDLLQAQFKKVSKTFDREVEAGRYLARSVALKDGALRHVGWLGAVPPAVTGLAAVYNAYHDEDVDAFLFTLEDEEEVYMSAEKDKKIQELESKLQKAETDRDQFKTDLDKTKGEFEDAKGDIKTLQKSVKDMEEQAEKRAAKIARSGRENQFAALVKQGLVLPADKDKVIAIAEAVGRGSENIEPCQFGEEGEKLDMEGHLWEFLASGKKLSMFQDPPWPEPDPDKDPNRDPDKDPPPGSEEYKDKMGEEVVLSIHGERANGKQDK